MKWNQALIDKYKNMITDDSIISQRGIECDKGWESIIDRALSTCRRLDPSTKIIQIKEKLGRLCIYIYTDTPPKYIDGKFNNEAYNVLINYEAHSITVCERCGQTGHKRAVNNSYLKTLCDNCFNEIIKEE